MNKKTTITLGFLSAVLVISLVAAGTVASHNAYAYGKEKKEDHGKDKRHDDKRHEGGYEEKRVKIDRGHDH